MTAVIVWAVSYALAGLLFVGPDVIDERWPKAGAASSAKRIALSWLTWMPSCLRLAYQRARRNGPSVTSTKHGAGPIASLAVFLGLGLLGTLAFVNPTTADILQDVIAGTG